MDELRPKKNLGIHRHLNLASTTAGAGLIEILVTLLLISTGVMALVTLQMQGLTLNRQAYYRSLLHQDGCDRL